MCNFRDVEAIYAINDTFAALTQLMEKTSSDLAKSRRNRLCHTAKRNFIWAKLNSRRNKICFQCAFAALLTNGSVVSFGWAGCGGDSSDVRNTLSSHIDSVVANDGAFAAVSSHGKAIVWGGSNHGGVLSEVLSTTSKWSKANSGLQEIS